jgi:hypothetical protein
LKSQKLKEITMNKNINDPDETPERIRTPSKNVEPRTIPGENAISFLRFFAWSDLIASIIGAVWVWVNFHEREVGVYFTYTETNPIGIAAGFVVLLEGIIAFTVFLVIAAICENTIEIRKKLGA